MNDLAGEYVKVFNDIMARNPTKNPVSLTVEIDEAQHKIDVDIGPTLFVQAWNAACKDPSFAIQDGTIKDCLYKWQYFWCYGALVQACRHAFADVVRRTFDTPTVQKPYVPDKVLFVRRVCYSCVSVCV